MPHYLRVAQNLALVSALSGAQACAVSHTRERGPDAAFAVDAAFAPDARLTPDAARVDAGVTCDTCECSWGSDDPDIVECEEAGLFDCCVTVGPLFPPDLPA